MPKLVNASEVDAVSDEMGVKRFYFDLRIAGLLLLILTCLGIWQRWNWPGTAFLLSYNYAVWGVVCAVTFAICCLFVWNLLSQSQPIWPHIFEIVLVLLSIHVVAMVFTILSDRGQDLITLSWFTFLFMFVPSLASSLAVLATVTIIGRLIRGS